MTILDAVATMKEAERVIARLMSENDALVARVAELEAALATAIYDLELTQGNENSQRLQRIHADETLFNLHAALKVRP